MEKNNIECCEKIEVHEELLKIVQEKNARRSEAI